MTTYLTYNGQPPRTEADEAVIANLVRKGWVITEPPVVEEVPQTYTAESWLAAQSYTPLRLLTCLDLEAKLAAASKTSPKLAAVRAWLDTITLLAAPDPDAQRTAAEWGDAPHEFGAASLEAITALSTP